MARITKPVEERRQEIINAARKLFIKNGFDKTQVSDISNKINVAQGLIYHYFKSKTEILYTVIDEMAAEGVETMKKTLEEYGGSALDRLKLLFNSNHNLKKHDKLIPSLMMDQAILDYCIKKMTVSVMPLLLSLIEQGNDDGSWSCEYPKETAVFILHGFSGLVEFYDPPKYDDFKIQAFTNIIFRILGAEQASS